ncbi:MAG: hypothetical protein VKM97_07335 [Cyanobacteriota bacterium]|nr:hypothetical protein [Cyanobacteriota bacterium]
MAIEGHWDERVPLSEIHDGIVEHLTARLEKLKAVYKGLKMKTGGRNREELLMKKIVHARLNYQRYMAATKDILVRCGEFVKTQRDTPETRIAFIRNAQDYFMQAKDFVKLDITFRKMSPTLLKYIEPKATDSPEIYARKRDLCRTMVGVLGKERSPQLTNGAGKFFRSKYIHQGKFLGRGFPSQWVIFLPPLLKEILHDSPEERRWPLTIMYIFSKFCSRVHVHQGFCPGCYFPILRDIGEMDTSGGKLFCYACGKEIEWTYHLNPRTIRVLLSGFHPLEIEDMKGVVRTKIMLEDSKFEDDEKFEPMLENCLKEPVTGEKELKVLSEDESDESIKPHMGEDIPEKGGKKTVSPGVGRGRPRSESPEGKDPEKIFKIISFREVVEKIREFMRRVYSDECPKLEQQLKDVYQAYKAEIQAFEGLNEEARYPRGFFHKIEKYIRHYYKVPSKEEVQGLPLDERGGKPGTNRGMVISALNNLNLSSFIDQTSLICEKLWGYSLPNLSEHRDQILFECILQKEVFLRLSSDLGRKSNLSQQLIFMFVVQRHGYKWLEEDFHISFSDTTKKKQMGIMRGIFEIIDQ